MPPYKLLALDLDGTIVDEDLQISLRTQQTLARVMTETDVRVVIATGRMHQSALSFARQLNIREPLVTYQGAMIRDDATNETLLHTPIPADLAKAVLDCLEAEDFQINVYVDDVLYTNHDNHYATMYSRMAGIEPTVVPSLYAVLKGSSAEMSSKMPTKMMVMDDHRIEDVLALLESRFTGQLTACLSRANFCEIMDAKASKWNAVKTLAERWSIPPSSVMAIGDQANDLSMITAAGLGVAMGNAPEHIKAQADFVTTSVEEDGAAEAIEKFILSPLNGR